MAEALASFLVVSCSMISFLVSVGADGAGTLKVGEERDVLDEDVLEECAPRIIRHGFKVLHALPFKILLFAWRHTQLMESEIAYAMVSRARIG